MSDQPIRVPAVLKRDPRESMEATTTPRDLVDMLRTLPVGLYVGVWVDREDGQKAFAKYGEFPKTVMLSSADGTNDVYIFAPADGFPVPPGKSELVAQGVIAFGFEVRE